MRKRRGLLYILIGLALTVLSGYMVLTITRRAAANAAATAAASAAAAAAANATTTEQPISKVYVVVAQKDIPANVAVSASDVAKEEFPAQFAPPGAIASPDIVVGKYTTGKIFKGQILVAPLLSETRQAGALASQIPEGKVAMAVSVNDALNTLGVLHPGDHVDILLTLDLSKGLPAGVNAPGTNLQKEQLPTQPQQELSTQLTMQNVEILAIGAPASEKPTQTNGNQTPPATQAQAQLSRTITFLLDHQDAVTLKYIKDSGGTMDLVLRGPDDNELAKTNAVTVDTLYREFRFRFVQPISQ